MNDTGRSMLTRLVVSGQGNRSSYSLIERCDGESIVQRRNLICECTSLREKQCDRDKGSGECKHLCRFYDLTSKLAERELYSCS